MFEFKPIVRNIQIEAMVTGIDVVRTKDIFFMGEMHDFWEIVFIENGRAVATADDRFYKLNSGKVLFHKPMEFHRIWSDRDSEPHLMVITFKASGEGMKYFENACFDLNLSEREKFCQIVSYFIKAIDYYENGNKEHYPIVSNIAAVMLENFLLSLTEKIDYSRSKLSYNENLYCNIVNVMKKNCEKNLSLQEISELCEMSASNIKRIFSLYSDVGPVKFYQTLRIRRAMELLSQGILPYDAAKQLNFKEVSYFYTVFKRETDMTPREYIESINSPIKI